MSADSNPPAPFPRLGEIIARVQSRFIHAATATEIFDPLLTDLLEFTGSEYGFIAEALDTADGHRFLRICVLTDVSWDDATRAMYQRHRSGEQPMEFHNLATLFGAVVTSGVRCLPDQTARGIGLPRLHRRGARAERLRRRDTQKKEGKRDDGSGARSQPPRIARFPVDGVSPRKTFSACAARAQKQGQLRGGAAGLENLHLAGRRRRGLRAPRAALRRRHVDRAGDRRQGARWHGASPVMGQRVNALAANSGMRSPAPPSRLWAARVTQSDSSDPFGRRGAAGLARRSSDEAPPRQCGPAGRLRRVAGADCERISGMVATTS
jgi:hypothetical protein